MLNTLNTLAVALQSFLVWQLILSVVILRRKYRVNQILGCLLVTTGVVLSVVRYVVEQLALFDYSFM